MGASICYLLAGQPSKAMAALDTTRGLKKSTKELDEMFNKRIADCSTRTLLDRLNDKRRSIQNINTLEVSKSIVLVGSDTCPGQMIPAGASYNDTGTTIGANNTVQSVQAGCSTYSTVAGPDMIYRFALPELAARAPVCTITLTPTGGTNYDPAIYALSLASCPAGTANAATNCVTGIDSGGANSAETISDARTDAMPAGTYYLFVDSFYSTGALSSGAYTLAINCTLVNPVVTAAGVTVGGRITTAKGRGIRNVVVNLTDQNGMTRTVISGASGYFRFDDVESGQTYVVTVRSRRFTFAPRVLEITDNISNLDFVPEQ